MNLYVISGVTGMTGSALAKRLIERGDEVLGFDNFFASSIDTIKEIINNEYLSFFEYDINNNVQMSALKDEILKIKDRYENIVYINCAAIVHTEHFYYVNRTFETNVLSMKKFLEQAIEVGAKTYINCSTSEVYSMDSWKEKGVSENDFLLLATAEHSQRTSYATGKLLTEFFMKEACDEGKIKGCSIRFANVYSKSELYAKHIIPHILNELRSKGSVELLENSKTNYRTFLHNDDSCSAVLALADTEAALDGTIYNVATDEEVSIIDLVNMCARKMGIENPKIEFKGFRESDPVRRYLNTDKIRVRTNWKPEISLERGIEMCLEEMKD